MTKICLICKATFTRPNWKVWEPTRFCSRECYGKNLSKLRKGSGNPYWNGGSTKASQILAKKNWKKNHPEEVRVMTINRRAKLKNAVGKFTAQEWLDIMKQYNYLCASCGESKSLTVDHIIPISKGGENNIQNIQPLCTHCNCVKHTKTINYNEIHPISSIQ